MLQSVVDMFSRKKPARDAALALARILSQYDMERLSFDEGLREERRARDPRHVAMGVWLFPCEADSKASDFKVRTGVPAVTHDLRAEGFGIMTPMPLDFEHCFVATPEDATWRFFRCSVRHNTPRDGGWYQLGLQVDCKIELDGHQRTAFREHIEMLQSSASS